MLVNSHLKFLMTIACQLELMLNILLPIHILKMVWLNHLSGDFKLLLMKSKLLVSTWGHAILHVASLVRIRPIAYHKLSPLQLVLGQQPNIFHLHTFGCAVYVPIAPPQRIKMGLNVDLEFIRVLIPHLSLDILSL